MDEEWRLLDVTASGFDELMDPMLIRATPRGAEARFGGGPARLNAMGGYHGGFLAAAAEKCLFLPLYLTGQVDRSGVVTIDFALQYVQPADPLEDIVARVELVHQTGRLAFSRGELVQADRVAVTFAGTLRKLSAARKN